MAIKGKCSCLSWPLASLVAFGTISGEGGWGSPKISYPHGYPLGYTPPMDIHDNHVNTLTEFHRRILLFAPPKNPYPPCKTMNEGIMYPWFSKGVRAHCIRLPYPFRKPWDTWLFAHGFCLGVWNLLFDVFL